MYGYLYCKYITIKQYTLTYIVLTKTFILDMINSLIIISKLAFYFSNVGPCL